MGWARFDDRLPENPKIDALSDGAFRLYVNAILYCAGNLTDGFIPATRVARLTPHYSKKHLAELLNHNLWHKRADGYDVHDYLEYQPSAAQVTEQREQERQRKAEQRKRGRANTERNTANGQFKSRQVSHRDNPPDNQQDSGRESRRESPATHPIPSSSNYLSSSSPLLAPTAEEEEGLRAEAQRRLADVEQRLGPRTDPTAWMAACVKRLRDEDWTPTTSSAPRTPCDNPECANGFTLTADGAAARCPACTATEEDA